MKRSAVLAALIAMGAAAYAAPAGAATRHYWVAAVPVTWNMIPNGRDAIMGTRYDPAQTVFGTVIYRRYTKNWKRPTSRPVAVPSMKPVLTVRTEPRGECVHANQPVVRVRQAAVSGLP